MAVIQTRLTSDNKQHDEAFKKSRQQVYNYKKTTTQAKDSLLSFAKGGLGKLVPALGLATTALAGMEKTIKSSQISSDEFDRTIAAAKSTVDSFFISISTGNFDNFLNNLDEIKKKAIEAADSLDRLQTKTLTNTAAFAKYNSERSRLERIIKDPKSTAEEIKSAQKELDELPKTMAADFQEEADYAKDYFIRAFDDIAQKVPSIWNRRNDILNNSKPWESQDNIFEFYEDIILRRGRFFDKLNNEQQKQMVDSYVKFRNLETTINQLYSSNSKLLNKKTTTSSKKEEVGINIKEEVGINWEDLETINKYAELLASKPLAITSQWKENIIQINEEVIASEENAADIIEQAEKRKQEAAEKTAKVFSLQLETLNSLGDVFSNIGNTFELKGLNIMGIISEAIANIIKGYATASADSAKYGAWAWAAFSVAGLAQITSVISQIHSLSGYANGGIIGGNSYSGDRVLARVNSGEMILNGAQQSKLFSMLNTGGTTGIGNVVFKISGNDLVGVLNNYNKKVGRVL